MVLFKKLLLIGLILGFSQTATAEQFANPENKKSHSWKTRRWEPSYPKSALPILQGYTDNSTTQITVLSYSEAPVVVMALPLGPVPAPKKLQEKVTISPNKKWKVTQLQFGNLSIGNRYLLRVNDENGRVVDERVFRSLDLNIKKPKIATLSCALDFRPFVGTPENWFNTFVFSTWEQVWKSEPDILFLLGDNVYADRVAKKLGKKYRKQLADVDQLWRRYVETWSRVPLYRKKRLIPSLAIWDDHDMGNDDGDNTYPHMKESQNIFRTFYTEYPNWSETLEGGPADTISYVWQAFGYQFLFLDGRSHRTPRSKANANDGNARHLGKKQETWALKKVKEFDGMTWLVKGDQFFGGYHTDDSFEGNHLANFKNFLNELSRSGKIVGFLSGDRHYSEIREVKKAAIPYLTWEVTSSAIHSIGNYRWKSLAKHKETEFSKRAWDDLKEGHHALVGIMPAWVAEMDPNFVLLTPLSSDKNSYTWDVLSVGNKGQSIFGKKLTFGSKR